MSKAARIITLAARRLRGVKVVALVGKSGSGKSFRAGLVADKRGIPLIVDDGLIIHSRTILAGHWAKKERSLVASVRRALFEEASHAGEARAALRTIPFRSILITATSERMARRIAANLWLPPPREVIVIENVATRREIEQAMRHRARRRAHSSPIPQVRIRRSLLSSLRTALAGAGGRRTLRARVTAPSAAGRGSVAFDEAALTQMALHCVKEYDARIEVLRVSLLEDGGMAVLQLSLKVPGPSGGSGRLHDLRDAILHGMEQATGVIFRDVRLTVDAIDFQDSGT
jgi:hypothetical protein